MYNNVPQKYPRKVWDHASIKKLIQLRMKGYSYKILSNIFFVSNNAIRKTLNRYCPLYRKKKNSQSQRKAIPITQNNNISHIYKIQLGTKNPIQKLININRNRIDINIPIVQLCSTC